MRLMVFSLLGFAVGCTTRPENSASSFLLPRFIYTLISAHVLGMSGGSAVWFTSPCQT